MNLVAVAAVVDNDVVLARHSPGVKSLLRGGEQLAGRLAVVLHAIRCLSNVFNVSAHRIIVLCASRVRPSHTPTKFKQLRRHGSVSELLATQSPFLFIDRAASLRRLALSNEGLLLRLNEIVIRRGGGSLLAARHQLLDFLLDSVYRCHVGLHGRLVACDKFFGITFAGATLLLCPFDGVCRVSID